MDDYDMGSTTMFDTHEFVTEMTRAKMPTQQAELLAKTYANLLNDRLATKQDIGILKKDIESLRKELMGEIGSVRTELKGDMKSLRTELKAEIEANKVELTNAILRAQITTIVIMSGIMGVMMAVLGIVIVVVLG